MGLTLDELTSIRYALSDGASALNNLGFNSLSVECISCKILVEREIKLKELEKTIPTSDISGHSIEGGD